MRFRDLGAQYESLKAEMDNAIQAVIEKGAFIQGPQVRELEEQLAEYVGVKNCVACANGTDAISLVLMAWGIGKGDAVFVPNFTYIATASPVSLIGATPVFVDIDTKTFNISPTALESAIKQTIKEGSLNPKAIIPVDLFGLPADYAAISAIADKYKLLILEDGAQGFGGVLDGKKACSFGDAAMTSFFPAKPLGCYGDGGAVFTNDDELCKTLKMLRVNGASPENKYDNKMIGVNSRLDTIQAAILLVKLNAFKKYELDKSNSFAAYYSELLEGSVATPYIPKGYTSAWAQYTIQLQDKKTRDELQSNLSDKGIPSMVYYPMPLHKQRAFKYLEYNDTDFPNAVKAAECVLSLPIHSYMKTEEIEIVCKVILETIK